MRRRAILMAALLASACHDQQDIRKANATADAAVSSKLMTRAATAVAAADRLDAAAHGAAIPREADPAFRPSLDAVFDTSEIPQTTRTREDLVALGRWMNAVTKVGRIYVFAGANPGRSAMPLAVQSDRNLVTYAPEIGRFSDAEVVLASRAGATVYILAATGGIDADHKADALAGVQVATRDAYSAALALIALKAPTDAWKEDRAKLLAATAPRIAPALDPQTWSRLQTEARSIAETTRDEALKGELDDFAAKIAPAR